VLLLPLELAQQHIMLHSSLSTQCDLHCCRSRGGFTRLALRAAAMQRVRTNRQQDFGHSGVVFHRRFEAPTRAEAAAAVLRLVRLHPDHDIVIGVDSLGKGGVCRV
jgi:hypothetical protein